MVFEILTFDFYLEEKRRLQTTVYKMEAHHNGKMKELIYPPPNIVSC